MVISKLTWKKAIKQVNFAGSDTLNKNQKPVGYYYIDLINSIKLIIAD